MQFPAVPITATSPAAPPYGRSRLSDGTENKLDHMQMERRVVPGTLQVLEAMRKGTRGRFVYVSSSEVYRLPDSGRSSEDIVPAPTTVYGTGTLAGELVTQAYYWTYMMAGSFEDGLQATIDYSNEYDVEDLLAREVQVNWT